MAKYAVNEEGVMALKTMSAAIVSASEQITALANALRTCADEHADTLGPHKESIDSVIEDIEAAEKAATDPVNGISDMLNEVADAYQDIIGDDRIKSSGGK